MNSLDFLQSILPTTGCYVKLLVKPGSAPRQYFYDTIDGLHDSCMTDSARGDVNVYYAVASFKDNSSRKQTNVQALKCLFIDIDCGPGKPYTDVIDGMRALRKFISTTNMPVPTVVSSGNGLHVYWPFTEEVTVERWKPLADAFKTTIANHNFDVDRSVPADSARVLRPVGTVNLKGGNTVGVLTVGVPTDVTTFENMFTVVVPNHSSNTLHGHTIPAHIAARAGQAPAVNLATHADTKAMPGAVASKCLQIKWGVENQKDVTEPFWYAMLGVAAYCVEPEETAKSWSEQHPDYSEATTLAKMARWKATVTGPATCKKFLDERPKGCDKCPLRGKITTPVGIGVYFDKVEIAADAPDRVAFDVPMPTAYKRTSHGIYRTLDITDISVCNFDLYPLGYGRDEVLGYETVRFKWKRPHIGWTDLMMRQAYLNEANTKECSTALADQGVVLRNKGQLEEFQNMLRSYMDELRKIKTMTNMYGSMGWKEESSRFLIGARLMSRDENNNPVVDSVSMPGTGRSFAEDLYSVAGTMQKSYEVTEMLEKANMPAHKFAILVGLSAPLYQFAGLDGLIVNLYGKTGSGKSLAQLMTQSMWGNPDLLHFRATFTQNAMFSRLGFHCNLPMTIDETTIIENDVIAGMCFVVSQGRDKARLNRYAEERTAKTWATPVITSANKRFADVLPQTGEENEAQLARLIDILVPTHRLFSTTTDAGKLIHEVVTSNYGHIGPALLERLMSYGEVELRRRIKEHYALFAKTYNFKFAGHERFWEQAVVMADFIGKEAEDAGLIGFTRDSAIRYALQCVVHMRKSVDEVQHNAFDRLSQYINEHVRNTVLVMHTGTNRGVIDPNRAPRDSIYIRLDVYRNGAPDAFDRGTMMIDKNHLRAWLLERGTTLKNVMNELDTRGATAFVPSGKTVMSKGIDGMRLRQTTVLGINLQHPEFIGMLDEVENHVLGAAQAKLSVVK